MLFSYRSYKRWHLPTWFQRHRNTNIPSQEEDKSKIILDVHFWAPFFSASVFFHLSTLNIFHIITELVCTLDTRFFMKQCVINTYWHRCFNTTDAWVTSLRNIHLFWVFQFPTALLYIQTRTSKYIFRITPKNDFFSTNIL